MEGKGEAVKNRAAAATLLLLLLLLLHRQAVTPGRPTQLALSGLFLIHLCVRAREGEEEEVEERRFFTP